MIWEWGRVGCSYQASFFHLEKSEAYSDYPCKYPGDYPDHSGDYSDHSNFDYPENPGDYSNHPVDYPSNYPGNPGIFTI